MRSPAHAPATVPPASVDRGPAQRGGLKRLVRRIGRLRRSRVAGRAVLAVGSLAFAGLIALALSGVGFARIGRSLSNVHPWWLVAALALNGLSMFVRAGAGPVVATASSRGQRLR
jgi:uncharacterized membrane protein YbhN (UPF0104 family)